MPWWGMEGQWTTNPLGVVFFIFNCTVVFNGPVRAHSEKYYFTCFRSHHKGPWMFTVKPGKLWTSEIFLECYCLAREKPIRHKKTKLQARTLISLWFCAQFTCPDLCCDSHNTINILKIFQVFTVSWSHCNKGIVNWPVRLKGNLKCIYGNHWLYGIMGLEQVYGCCFADKSLLTGVRLCLWWSVPTAISV